MSKMSRSTVAGVCLTATFIFWSIVGPGAGRAGGKWDFAPSVVQKQAIAAISAESLRGHLSFIASDLLDGRGNGTEGEEVAAEYIAAQFRRSGLKPAGDDGFYQTVPKIRLMPNLEGYRCRISLDGKTADVPSTRFAMISALGSSNPIIREIHIDNVPIVKIPFSGSLPDQSENLKGRVLMTEFPAVPRDRTQAANIYVRRQEFMSRVGALNPALLVEIRRGGSLDTGYFRSRSLIDPEQKGRPATGIPLAAVTDPAVVELYDALADGQAQGGFSLHLSGSLDTPAPLRNVVGLLPGADPKLAETYILITAHYDGQGTRPGSEGGWNSANDDGSGTVSVIEIAAAMASLKERPRRSLVFMTFYGEEIGLAGSRYYAQHPVFPIEKTIAEINLEMVGRTDDTEGDQHKRASLTGFDYTDLGDLFRRAGDLTGVTVFKHEKNSDSYFGRSDNQALANMGVPAHTLCVTFNYPDYHGAADTWEKIDYDNMALTVRMIATAVLILAESDGEPRWNESLPQASRYLAAWKKIHEGGKH